MSISAPVVAHCMGMMHTALSDMYIALSSTRHLLPPSAALCDNYINLNPFIGTKETRVKALQETARIKRELPQSGLLYHLLEGPSTRIIFLGWGIDTEKWIIFITDERKKFMIEFLGEWERLLSHSKTYLLS